MLKRVTLALVLLLAPTLALANSTTPVAGSIDFTQPLRDITKKPVKDKDGAVVTIGESVANCLLSEKGAKLYFLAQKLYGNKAMVLSPEDATEIKKCVDDNMSALVSGQVDPVVDPTFKP